MTTTAQMVLILLVFLASALYSSVGHAGASGDIAAMGLMGVPADQMKPIALVLNIFVATIVTFRFYRAGYFSWSLLWPFVITSVPFAFIGGRITLQGAVYRPLVGALLLYAAYRLVALTIRKREPERSKGAPLVPAMLWGALIGLLSGLTGVGGGIFLSPLLLLMGWGGDPRIGRSLRRIHPRKLCGWAIRESCRRTQIASHDLVAHPCGYHRGGFLGPSWEVAA